MSTANTANTVTFGDDNAGFQTGTIHGSVNAEFHHHHHPAPERPETPPNPSIMIPYGRDRNFVERGELLTQIESSCGQPGSRTALVGLGGVGKSQLAIEYAYRTRDQSPLKWVFWIHASNAARFEQSFGDIATSIKVSGRQNPKTNIFQHVHKWLLDERKGPWVVVLDNVDDASFLTSLGVGIEAGATTTESANSRRQLISYIPQCQHGSILITSRTRDAALELVDDADIITIQPMNNESALQLFRNKLGQNEDEACIAELAAALEHMPLAIVQAAGYILQRRPRCSAREYLDNFCDSDKRKVGLLGFDGGKLGRDSQAKNSILITWQLSFDYIQDNRSSAADLLSLMSFCDRQGIPEVLLRSKNERRRSYDRQNPHEKKDSIGEESKHINVIADDESTSGESDWSDDDRFENDIATLRNFSFITANDDGTTFQMHRLVQLATLEWLRARGVYEQRRHQFLVQLCTELPEGVYENMAKCQALFPHVKSVSAQRPTTKESMEEWATILYKAADYAIEVGKYIEAEDLSIRAMKVRQKIFDKDHEDVLCSKAIVASAYGQSSRWDKAEKLQVQVLQTRKMKLGKDHSDTLISMSDLALTYSKQGRWEAAEQLQVQVLETYKMRVGEDHPDTLISIGELALIYSKQGRWEAAEQLQLQVLETYKIKLGQDHPNTLTSMSELALTYSYQGRWEAARQLQLQVLETRKTKLGEDHPDTLTSMSDLASTYSYQGWWEAAEQLQVQVLETRKTKLGEDHPDTLISIDNLALIYSDQGRWKAAEQLEIEVLETRRRELGEDHPDTLISIDNLALIYRKQGWWEAAEQLQAQVLETSKEKLGEDHPHTLTSMVNLAWTYWDSKRSEEAKTLMRRCVQLRRARLGASHPNYIFAAKTLARWEA